MSDCEHGDPAARMYQLLTSLHDAERFADLLFETVGCVECGAAALAETVFSLGGVLMDLQEQQEREQRADDLCECARPVCAESIAMRLVMTDPNDVGALGIMLNEFLGCDECTSRVIVAQSRVQKALLDETKQDWRPIMERELFALLDEKS